METLWFGLPFPYSLSFQNSFQFNIPSGKKSFAYVYLCVGFFMISRKYSRFHAITDHEEKCRQTKITDKTEDNIIYSNIRQQTATPTENFYRFCETMAGRDKRILSDFFFWRILLPLDEFVALISLKCFVYPGWVCCIVYDTTRQHRRSQQLYTKWLQF